MTTGLFFFLLSLVFSALWIYEREGRKKAQALLEQLKEEREFAELRRRAMPFFPESTRSDQR
jgi:hypothetical protein